MGMETVGYAALHPPYRYGNASGSVVIPITTGNSLSLQWQPQNSDQSTSQLLHLHVFERHEVPKQS